MTHRIGDPRKLEINVLDCVERLWGEMALERAKKLLARREP